jgi:signal transduction histidine kinase
LKRLLPRTVFGRSLLVLVFSGVATQLMIVAVIVTASRGPEADHFIQRNIDRYIAYLSQDIGRQLTPEHAREVLEGTGFDARISGAGAPWSTSISPDSRPGGRSSIPMPNGDSLMLEKGRPVFESRLETERGPASLTLLGPKAPPLHQPFAHIFVLFGGLLIVLLTASLAMRAILQPIHALSLAFDEMKTGKTAVAVPVRRDDELGRLARSFNEMASRLDFLIRDKERLFTEISHEFRAPIARAVAANAFVESTEIQSAIQHELAELDSLIHALLTAARREAGDGDAGQVDLAALLDQAGRLFPDQAARLVREPGPSQAVVDGDRRTLLMLLRNLIENGLKYSPPDRKVALRLVGDGREVCVVVRDEGIGIAPEELPRIFDSFYRGQDDRKVSRPGFGLGLSLCRRIATAHGGELEVDSAPGQGTTIRLRLPAHGEPAR